MLMLARQRAEEIVMTIPASDTPTRIVVMMKEIRCDRVIIGVEAPRSTAVHRREVHDRIEREAKADAENHPSR